MCIYTLYRCIYTEWGWSGKRKIRGGGEGVFVHGCTYGHGCPRAAPLAAAERREIVAQRPIGTTSLPCTSPSHLDRRRSKRSELYDRERPGEQRHTRDLCVWQHDLCGDVRRPLTISGGPACRGTQLELRFESFGTFPIPVDPHHP